jgi:hypothetical protein
MYFITLLPQHDYFVSNLFCTLGADYLTFEGGRADFEKTFWTKKIPALTNCGKKYPAPVFGGKKMLQNGMIAGIDLTSPRRSAGLIF